MLQKIKKGGFSFSSIVFSSFLLVDKNITALRSTSDLVKVLGLDSLN